MHKKLLPVLFIALSLFFMGCGTENNSSTQNAAPSQNMQTTTESAAINTAGDGEALLPPVMGWCKLYNPNGFDTVTALLKNPNSVAIEATFDFVYYKGGVEVARSEDFFCSGILPGGDDIVWANFDIPPASEVDEVKLENVTVSEPYYAPIEGKYEYLGVTDGEALFDFEFEKKPEIATINFLLYNDNNQNKCCDEDELVVVSSCSVLEQKGRASFITEGFDYTDFEVHYTAY